VTQFETVSLSDPRHYGPGDAAHPLSKLADDDRQQLELTRALRELAAAGRDVDIGGVLAAAPSPPAYARMWRALCDAVEKPTAGEGVIARVFAIPWVIVCGASSAATLPCVLPDVGELARVLEANGVFGGSRNLGLGSTLVSIETLERLRPSEILQWSQAPGVHDVPPAEIHVIRGVEEVHVRFLLGASVADSIAPGIVETGSNIGVWGTPALRAMTAQLATAGVQILPMPRPPAAGCT